MANCCLRLLFCGDDRERKRERKLKYTHKECKKESLP